MSLDELLQQRTVLLNDCRDAYTDRYLDEPVRYDWPGFVEDELARLDAEIARAARMGDIGEGQREIEAEPLNAPPVPEPVRAPEPVCVPERAPEPVGVPA